MRIISRLAFGIFVALFFTFNAYAFKIKICYEDKEQPPYYMGTTNQVLADKPGVAVEIVQMLEGMIEGLKIELIRAPWPRCTAYLGKNYVDGIFNASYKKKRLKIGWYPTIDGNLSGPVDISRRIATISYSLYKLKYNKIDWDGKKFINADGIVGAPRGYSIVDDLKSKGLIVQEAPSTKMNLDKLIFKRVVAVALQDVTGEGFLKSAPTKYKDIVKVNPPLVTKPYYLMLSHKLAGQHPILANKIWDSIKIIRETKLEEIVMKYN